MQLPQCPTEISANIMLSSRPIAAATRFLPRARKLTPRPPDPYTMMSMYGGSNGNSSPPTPQRSNQACLTCKKQKRKCDKVLPRCSLCTRMNRSCDYTDAPPTPTTDDFVGLQRQIKGLEARLNSQMSPERGHGAALNGVVGTPPTYGTPTTYTTPTRGSGSSAADQEMSGYGYSMLSQYPLHGIQNKFPSIAFLDRDAFKHGG